MHCFLIIMMISSQKLKRLYTGVIYTQNWPLQRSWLFVSDVQGHCTPLHTNIMLSNAVAVVVHEQAETGGLPLISNQSQWIRPARRPLRITSPRVQTDPATVLLPSRAISHMLRVKGQKEWNNVSVSIMCACEHVLVLYIYFAVYGSRNSIQFILFT